MHPSPLPYITLYLMAALVSLGIALHVWWHRSIRGARTFLLVSLGVFIWSGGVVMELVSPSLGAKQLWTDIQMFGVVILPLGWLAFAWEYGRVTRRVLPLMWALLALEPLLTVYLAWTNGSHSLFWRTTWLDTSGPIPILASQPAIWYWINLVYSYVLYLVGTILIILGLSRAAYLRRWQFGLLAFSVLAPLVFSITDSAGLNPFPRQELTPLAVVLTEIVFAIGIFRFRQLDIVPVARGALIESLGDGVIVVDSRQRVIDLNPAAEALAGFSVAKAFGLPLDQLLLFSPENAAALCSGQQVAMEIAIGEGEKRRYFDLRSTLLSQDGCVIVLHDVSDHRRLQDALQASEEKYRSVVERSSDGIIVVQEDLIRYANPQMAAMLGYSTEQLEGTPYINYFLPENKEEIEQRLARRMRGEAVPIRYQYRMLHHSGHKIDVEINAGLMQYEGRPAVLGLIRDISESILIQNELQSANQELKSTIEELEQRNQEVTLLNEMGDRLQKCASVEEAYAVIAEFSLKLFPSQSGALYMLDPFRDILVAVATWGDPAMVGISFPPNDCWALRFGHKHIVKDEGAGPHCVHLPENPADAMLPYACIPLIIQDDTLGVYHLRGLPARSQGAWDHLAVSVAEYIAVSLANLNLRETLRIQSIRDTLTGLYNRRYLEEALVREIRRAVRYQHQVVLIMLDIDEFKNYNDTIGHEAGDTVLRMLGGFLLENIRGGDIVCRYGGDEIVVILPEVSLEDGRRRAEQLREGVKNLEITINGRLLNDFTISLGVASFPEHGLTAETLLRAADAALYHAKENGRDYVAVGGQLDD
ncbi:MAG: diguanylate cyclase [Anaerolineaceae bacterium]|nr:diguanylate cyclase [Anaerolineaceae bacterium]